MSTTVKNIDCDYKRKGKKLGCYKQAVFSVELVSFEISKKNLCPQHFMSLQVDVFERDFFMQIRA